MFSTIPPSTPAFSHFLLFLGGSRFSVYVPFVHISRVNLRKVIALAPVDPGITAVFFYVAHFPVFHSLFVVFCFIDIPEAS